MSCEGKFVRTGPHSAREGGNEVRTTRYAVTPAADAGVGFDARDGLVEHRHHPVAGDGRGLDRKVNLISADSGVDPAPLGRASVPVGRGE